MIDEKIFNLKYICKTSKEIFNARTVGSTHIAVMENGDEKIYTVWEARLKFTASKNNRKAGMKPAHAHPIARSPRTRNVSPRKFKEYLNEREEYLVLENY